MLLDTKHRALAVANRWFMGLTTNAYYVRNLLTGWSTSFGNRSYRRPVIAGSYHSSAPARAAAAITTTGASTTTRTATASGTTTA